MALERATKIIGLLMHSSKEYVCVMQLHEDVSEDELKKAFNEFRGRIYQRPPLRSSVKRAIRVKTIYELEVLEKRGKYGVFRVTSDPGTYIRKLCWDIGLVLGVGAHMRELRRTRTGPIKEDLGLVKLQDLSEAVYLWKTENREDAIRKVVYPAEYLVCSLPKVVLRDSAVESIVNGARLAVPGIAMVSDRVRRGDIVALLTLKGELVALGRAVMSAEAMLSLERGIAVEPERVVLEPGIYPRMWKRSRSAKSSTEEPETS
ncbi:MAG: RNA-guided pseudouridylation complex pseudouridine synthase subunit Cbf5 [Acidilobaceae archaeon]